MKHYCSGEYPPCFVRYEDSDTPESIVCGRSVCSARAQLTVNRAVETSTVQIPSLRQEAAMRAGTRR